MKSQTFCPISKKTVENPDLHSSDFNGQKYSFCCSSHKQNFDENPGSYAMSHFFESKRRQLKTIKESEESEAGIGSITVPVFKLGMGGPERVIGKITFEDSSMGLVIDADIRDLPPGIRGFHIHENPTLGPGEVDGEIVAGGSAGPHFDPDGGNQHKGPYGMGHRGDMPFLSVSADGTCVMQTLAPRISLQDILGKSFIIHAGGDNYSDSPKKLGGGGERIAGGIIV